MRCTLHARTPPPRPMPRVDHVIVGGGLSGVSTAYHLVLGAARRGLRPRVAVLEASPLGPARSGASHANGAQLAYSFCDALASPQQLRKLPSYVMGRGPIRVHAQALRDPHFWKWSLAFARECLPGRWEHNTQVAARLGLRSRDLLHRMLHAHPGLGAAMRWAQHGKAVMMGDAASVCASRHACGVKNNVLRAHRQSLGDGDGDEAWLSVVSGTADHIAGVCNDPNLKQWTGEVSGAIWTPSDAVADPVRFCDTVVDVLKQPQEHADAWKALGATVVPRPVAWAWGQQVEHASVDARGDSVASVTCSDGTTWAAGHWIVCAGLGAVHLPPALVPGPRLPVQPMRGYSITVPLRPEHAPHVSITDAVHKMVYTRLGDSHLRVAGMAEFPGSLRDPRHSGYGLDPGTSAPIQHMLSLAKARLPLAAHWDSNALHAWSCCRPLTPDSLPIVGPAGVGASNVTLNTGHGGIGWTIAQATAEAAATLALDGGPEPPHIGLQRRRVVPSSRARVQGKESTP